MGKNVVIIGTLDTKGPEIAYLRDRLQALGLETTVVDSGILGEPVGIKPDISRAEAATYAGTTIEALRSAGSRGKAVHGMREALEKPDPRALQRRQAAGHREHGRGRRRGDGRGGHDAAAGRRAESAGLADRLWQALFRSAGRDQRHHGRALHRRHPGAEPDRHTIFDNVAAALQGAGRARARIACPSTRPSDRSWP
jgi:hypothetical protein